MEKKPEDAMLTATCMLICAVVIICEFNNITKYLIKELENFMCRKAEWRQ